MTKPLLRWSLVLGLALGAGAGFSRLSRAESPAVQQTVAVDQLKSDAFLALRAGQFDKTNELLARAAELSTDPVVKQMSSWLVEFEAQRGVFVAERRKQYQKAVDDMQKLLDHGYTDYALDPAARALQGRRLREIREARVVGGAGRRDQVSR